MEESQRCGWMKKSAGSDVALVLWPALMKYVLVLALLLGLPVHAAFSQERGASRPSRGMVIAFADTMRLGGRESQSTLDDFRYYLEKIREIAKREFPDVELKILDR